MPPRITIAFTLRGSRLQMSESQRMPAGRRSGDANENRLHGRCRRTLGVRRGRPQLQASTPDGTTSTVKPREERPCVVGGAVVRVFRALGPTHAMLSAASATHRTRRLRAVGP